MAEAFDKLAELPKDADQGETIKIKRPPWIDDALLAELEKSK